MSKERKIQAEYHEKIPNGFFSQPCKLRFLRDGRKPLHRHLTPDWTKFWKMHRWEQSHAICGEYDFICTGKYCNTLIAE